MPYLTECDTPLPLKFRCYKGFHVKSAMKCLEAGYEENAASWMWMDQSEIDEGFAPVKGSLQACVRRGRDVILYVDARDVAKELECTNGGSI